MPTFYRYPNPNRGEFNREFGGIVEVLRNYSKHLPTYGWDEVHNESDADLVVGHLSTPSEHLDVFHLHGLYPTADLNYSGGYRKSNATIIENIRRAHYTICVSDWVAQILRRDMHLSPWVLGHGIDYDAWQQIPKGTYCTDPFVYWNKTRPSGVCDPLPVLELARRLPRVQFVTTFLPRTDSPPPANVTVTGLLKRPAAWRIMRDCTVHLGTTKETFGLSSLEALASGAVTVGYNWGATPGIIGDCGLFVRPDDLDGLAAIVLEALERHDELGAKSRLRVQSGFSWQHVVGELARFYTVALNGLQSVSPKVSVVVPVHNYEKFVRQAIRSVLAQTYADYELVVVDDGSTDDSVAVIQDAIRDVPHARLVRQPNAGVAHARNRGIAEARGEYICCLDADDCIAPEFLATLVPALDSTPTLGIVYTGIRLMDALGNVHQRIHTWPRPFQKDRVGDNQIPTCCLFRRIWWQRLGGYRQRYTPRGAGQEDADFWFRILANGGGAEMVVPDGLFFYRRHQSQATVTHRETWQRNAYSKWYPFVEDGQHPLASQLANPKDHSWSVRNYDCPQVSVVIPVGPNHAHLVVDALDSLEAQSFRQWEAVVVNDSGEILDLTPWPYAKLIETDGNRGAGHARNLGIAASTAPLFVCLDADDFLQPDFLQETLDARHRYPDRWIYTDMFISHADGRIENYHNDDWNTTILWRRGIAPVTCLYSKTDWQQVGGYDEEFYGREDWDFHLRLARVGKCGIRIPRFLFTYRHATGKRRHAGSIRQEALKLRKLYDREELEMACRGCGSRTIARDAPPIPNWESKEDAGWVLLEYIGKNRNDLTFRGATNRTYRFGNNDFNRVKRVHPGDATRLQLHKCFRVVGTVEAQDGVLRAAAQPVALASPAPVEVIVAAIPIAGIEPELAPELAPEVEPKSKPISEPIPVPVPGIATFNPATLSVAKIQVYDFTGHDLCAILEREKADKNRKMVVRHLGKLIRRAEREAQRRGD